MKTLLEQHIERFKTEKPMIGCLHLRPLPSTPRWDREYTIEQHIDDLKREARILMDLGFDAAVFANEGDVPYVETVDPVQIAYYVRIVTEVSKILTIPFGVGMMLDPYATLAVAKATGAKFVRGCFYSAAVSDFGITDKNPGKIWRYAKAIGAEDIPVYTTIEPHAGTMFDTRKIEEIFKTVAFNLPIAGFILMGPGKEEPSQTTYARLKAIDPTIPLIFNNGSNAQNIQKMLPYCDGAIVGTALKEDHYLYNPMSYDNALEFITAAKKQK